MTQIVNSPYARSDLQNSELTDPTPQQLLLKQRAPGVTFHWQSARVPPPTQFSIQLSQPDLFAVKVIWLTLTKKT